MSLQDQRRAGFEAWAKANHMPLQRFGLTPHYENSDTQAAWIGWNAALDSAVIELTYVPVLKVDGSGLEGMNCAYLQRDGVLKAIEAAGVRVKP